jgi:extracellular elastinolytic metalloproteinase
VSADAIHFRTGYSTDVVSHAYVHQAHDGVLFANAVANVAFHADGKVASLGSSFVKTSTHFPLAICAITYNSYSASIASSTPTVSVAVAIQAAEAALGGQYNSHPTELRYVVKPDHSAVLAHSIQIQNDVTGAWYDAFVDAHSGELVAATDFVAKATVCHL